MITVHRHIDLREFREAQKIAQRCGVDPYNSADRVWAAHELLTYNMQDIYSEADANRVLAYEPNVNMFGEAPSAL